MMNFQLTSADLKKISEWLHGTVYPPVIERQLKDPNYASLVYTDDEGLTWPYTGAIGGSMTYSFTPTGLGIIVKVECFGQTLDLTEYDCW